MTCCCAFCGLSWDIGICEIYRTIEHQTNALPPGNYYFLFNVLNGSGALLWMKTSISYLNCTECSMRQPGITILEDSALLILSRYLYTHPIYGKVEVKSKKVWVMDAIKPNHAWRIAWLQRQQICDPLSRGCSKTNAVIGCNKSFCQWCSSLAIRFFLKERNIKPKCLPISYSVCVNLSLSGCIVRKLAESVWCPQATQQAFVTRDSLLQGKTWQLSGRDTLTEGSAQINAHPHTPRGRKHTQTNTHKQHITPLLV